MRNAAIIGSIVFTIWFFHSLVMSMFDCRPTHLSKTETTDDYEESSWPLEALGIRVVPFSVPPAIEPE